MDGDANLLVARARQGKLLRERADAPIHLGDRRRAAVEAAERGEQASIESRCGSRHDFTIAGEVSRDRNAI